ncbi:MAG: tyrosine-type recombinase/integrase [bacterium]|nr:tyrosine-type recombinase/integrase [bacterium]
MPALITKEKFIKKTNQKEKFFYIVENYTEIQDGKKRYKRRILKSLGRISKRQANIELSRFIDNPVAKLENIITTNILFTAALKIIDDSIKKTININIKESTYESFQYGVNFCEKYFLNHMLKDIGFIEIENFKQWLEEKKLSARSKNIVLIQLRKIFKYAVKRQWIKFIPLIESVKESKSNIIDRLTNEEIALILECDNQKLKFYIKFMLLTGLRPAEFKILKWSHISYEEKYIHIISDNKLKKGRKIPLDQQLEKTLIDWKESIFCFDEYVSPYRRPDSVVKLLKKHGKKYGINLNSYTLRKTFASIMAENGVDRGELAEIMGNTIATGEKYYIDVRHQHLMSAMEKRKMRLNPGKE